MKTFQRTTLAAIFLLAAQWLPAQSKKVDTALEGFKNTSFMLQFLDLRTQMETTARGFKNELDNGWQNADPNRRTKIDLPERPSIPILDTRFDSQWEWQGAAPGNKQ